MKFPYRPAALILLSVALATGSAVAAESKAPTTKANRDEAQRRYEHGRELYDESDYRGALVEFERAYELSPSFRLRYSIALVQHQLQDYAGALRSYERYLQEGGGDIPSQRREEVQREMSKLRSRVATLTITTSRPGAEVTVDDVPVGTSPLREPLVVSAGRRRISASLPGQPPVSRVVDVAGSDTLTLALELGTPVTTAPTPAAATTQGTAPMDVTTEVKPRGVPWAAWGTTGGLVVAAGVSGLLAKSASSELETKRGTFGVTRAELDDASKKTKQLALMTDVLAGAALVSAGVSTWLTLSRGAEEPASTASLQVGIGPGGVAVAGSF